MIKYWQHRQRSQDKLTLHVLYCLLSAYQSKLRFGRDTYQQPVLDLGGRRARGGTVKLVVPRVKLLLELADDDRSSFGAITGRRRCCFLEESTLLLPCITKVSVSVMGEAGSTCEGGVVINERTSEH